MIGKVKSSVAGDFPCDKCGQAYKQQYITDEGLCDWCDEERFDQIQHEKDLAEFDEWNKLSPAEREAMIKWHGMNPN